VAGDPAPGNRAVEIEGGLQITLRRQQDRIRDVVIESSRPLQAVKIFYGKSVAELLQTLPLLYHVCGVAQASAAVTACEQAMAICPGEATRQGREMLVWTETAREHLWRILIDWPDYLGGEKDKAAIARLGKFLPELKQALFVAGNGFCAGAQVSVNVSAVNTVIDGLKQLLKNAVFGMSLEQWLKGADKHALQCWQETTNTVATKMLRQVSNMVQDDKLNTPVDFLPDLDDISLHQRLAQGDADAFVAQPQWRGKPCETTVLCRQREHALVAALIAGDGNGIMTRMVARLVELAGIPATLRRLFQQLLSVSPEERVSAQMRPSGVGLGQVEAARGRLVHRLELEKGIVRRYQIVAPTEWNFHPRGVAAQLLRRLPAQDEVTLKKKADLLINTIDPCVRYELTCTDGQL
jgi:coenzyme F420-reducing hydrogenase alpha subunit